MLFEYLKQVGSLLLKTAGALAVIAGLISALSNIPDTLSISRGVFATMIVAIVVLLSGLIALLIAGYRLFRASSDKPTIRSCRPPKEGERSDVFQLFSRKKLDIKQLVVVHRKMEWGISLMGVIKVDRGPNDGEYQCSSIAIAPIHAKALSEGEIQPDKLSCTLLVNEDDFHAAAKHLRGLP